MKSCTRDYVMVVESVIRGHHIHKCGVVCEQKLAVDECIENGDDEKFIRSSAMSGVFIFLFTFLAHF